LIVPFWLSSDLAQYRRGSRCLNEQYSVWAGACIFPTFSYWNEGFCILLQARPSHHAVLVETAMKLRTPNMMWAGVALAAAFWVAESLLHTFVFDSGSLDITLLGESDPNELWMRLLIVISFVGFGWIAERSLRAERRLKEDADRLNRLLRFVIDVKQKFPDPVDAAGAHPHQNGLPHTSLAATGSGGDAGVIGELAVNDDNIGKLTHILQELSRVLDERFKELHALLQLTHEVNMGLLLDDVLEKAYETLKSVLPYNRLGLALLENNGRVIRARWAKADYPEMMLRTGYTGLTHGSSFEGIIASGEPRIINDLAAYLERHPLSDATRTIVAEGIRSSLTCPLISMGQPIGFMFFSSLTANSYKNVHVEVFKLIAGHLSVMVEKSNLYQQILAEKEKSERLLLNVMPARIAARLRAGAKSVAENLPEIHILFVDIVGFTGFASRYPPERVVHLLENIFGPLDRLCGLYGVEKIKTSGDEYMVMSGQPDSDSSKPLLSLAEFALQALRSVEGMRYPDGELVRIRLGMHTGPAVAGVIGQTKFAYDVWGDAVNIASRMESSGEAGCVHVTEEIQVKLQAEFIFEPRGMVDVKGKGPMKTYFMKARSRPSPAHAE
jgi:class 3 adenylate cyclase